jgi:FMN-dependent NADH-azoreductase
MARLLYVEASPRKQRSASIEVAQAFLAAYRAAHPDDEIETLDLWAVDLPEFDGAALEAKYAGLSGTPLTEAQETAWRRIRELAQPFHAAERLLFAVPLWNFGIPYKLKHLIDVVSQKDVLFSFTEQGFSGLLRGRKAAVIYARGLDYGAPALTPAAAFDFQRPYMEMWLRFIGVTDIAAITVEKTLFGPEVDTQARAEAKRRAEAVAKTF